MQHNGIELEEITFEQWDGKTREMVVWCDTNYDVCHIRTIIGYQYPNNGYDENYWADNQGMIWNHCAEIPNEEPSKTIPFD